MTSSSVLVCTGRRTKNQRRCVVGIGCPRRCVRFASWKVASLAVDASRHAGRTVEREGNCGCPLPFSVPCSPCPQAEGHTVLEFGGKATSEAAAYAPGVCRAWAADLADALVADTSRGVALHEVQLHSGGRVRRHRLRGQEEESAKERRQQEDRDSRAGMRCPAA